MIKITQEMLSCAQNEYQKRKKHIKSHFEVNHLNKKFRNILGFLGEFACQEYLKIDWKKNIRDNYLQPDKYDFIHKEQHVDVKTETIPRQYINSVINRTIDDNGAYGRRLISNDQISLLKNYDIIMFGCFLRLEHKQWNPINTYWYPIGMIKCEIIQTQYKTTCLKPFGGKYPVPCKPIKTSDLVDIE